MEERNAIVTGGLRGLGRAMALGLARAGCRVVAIGHIEADLADIDREIAGTPLSDRLYPKSPICAARRNATGSSPRPRRGLVRSMCWSTMPG